MPKPAKKAINVKNQHKIYLENKEAIEAFSELLGLYEKEKKRSRFLLKCMFILLILNAFSLFYGYRKEYRKTLEGLEAQAPQIIQDIVDKTINRNQSSPLSKSSILKDETDDILIKEASLSAELSEKVKIIEGNFEINKDKQFQYLLSWMSYDLDDLEENEIMQVKKANKFAEIYLLKKNLKNNNEQEEGVQTLFLQDKTGTGEFQIVLIQEDKALLQQSFEGEEANRFLIVNFNELAINDLDFNSDDYDECKFLIESDKEKEEIIMYCVDKQQIESLMVYDFINEQFSELVDLPLGKTFICRDDTDTGVVFKYMNGSEIEAVICNSEDDFIINQRQIINKLKTNIN